VFPLRLLDELSPHARVAPPWRHFLVALALRILLGKTRITSLLVSASTVWFAVNVLMAPYSGQDARGHPAVGK